MPHLNVRDLSTLTLFLACGLATRAQGLWSDPGTWPSGGVPAPGTDVEIAAGETIVLDVATGVLGDLVIRGVLRFDDRPGVALDANSITVTGPGALLEVGKAAQPFASETAVTIHARRADGTAPGNGGIMVMAGGSLEVHGAAARATDWTQLAVTAQAGASELRLAEPPRRWAAGDLLVVAPSGYDPREAEAVEIAGIDGRVVTLTEPLAYEHYAGIETYGERELDMRAEVGLLTRNIVFRGAPGSSEGVAPENGYLRGFGGHMMIMQGAGPVHVEGLELRDMGQTGVAARYPIHWHLAGDRDGDYVKHSSVNGSFHRAFVTHGSHGILVEGNVGYDVPSHMYVVSEEGIATRNVYRGNLGVLNYRLDDADETFDPNDEDLVDSRQSEHQPGVFWLTEWSNTLVGNHAAGSFFGMGFFYDGVPHYEPVTVDFRENVAHSAYRNTNGQVLYPPNTKGHGLFVRETKRDVVHEFTGLTAYKNSISGAWLEEESHLLTNSIMAANGTGVFSIRGSIEDCTIVGETANRNGSISNPGPTRKGAITVMRRQARLQAKDIEIFNHPNAAITWDHVAVMAPSFVEGLTLHDTPPLEFNGPEAADYGALLDLDGSLTGADECMMIFPAAATLGRVAEAVEEPTWNAYRAPCDRFVHLEFQTYGLRDANGEETNWGDDLNLVDVLGVEHAFRTYKWHQRNRLKHGYVPKNAHYFASPNGGVPEVSAIEVTGGGSEDYVTLEFPYGTDVYEVAWEGGEAVAASASYAALLAASGTTHYYDREVQRLYVRAHSDDTRRLILRNLSPAAVTADVAAPQRGGTSSARSTAPPSRDVVVVYNRGAERIDVRLGRPAGRASRVEIFSHAGKLSVGGEIAAGSRAAELPAGELPPGIYFAKVSDAVEPIATAGFAVTR